MVSYEDLMADHRSRFEELRRKERKVWDEQAYLMKELLDNNKRLIEERDEVAAADDKQRRIEHLEATLKIEESLRMEQENENLKLREFKASVVSACPVAIFSTSPLIILWQENSKFVLVLIDADAEMYWASFPNPQGVTFNDEYLKGGINGGAKAAQAFMAKVREYLVSTPELVSNPNSIQVTVKAYANLEALEKVCLAKRKIDTVGDLRNFWIGFTRAFAMCDVVDVGYGKEEADSKIRDVLNFNIDNVQCAHVLMACCHDTGYIPELRKYSVPATIDRITLLQVGQLRSQMENLGFRTTRLFEPLFSSSFTSKPAAHKYSSDPASTKKDIKHRSRKIPGRMEWNQPSSSRTRNFVSDVSNGNSTARISSMTTPPVDEAESFVQKLLKACDSSSGYAYDKDEWFTPAAAGGWEFCDEDEYL
ncbi:hypothetical protein HYFRA_00009010 [Hymenoscyphus fraxineus]|uniref:DUF7923 domain-containing protein n=1 Tax=Hymenoscyphus fraxineus TaxID=746836 RepID=A0A9N9KSJ4_9HELO|nr:hypothetical protein HYFRA_00009010 [Hymenoscyphus fraxineus]